MMLLLLLIISALTILAIAIPRGGHWPHDLVKIMVGTTPSPPTKSLDFRGFDSSRLLIIRGGNSHVR